MQREIASPPIPNLFFFWEKGGAPGLPAKLARAYGARERPPESPVFRTPTFTLWLRH